jgi:hypothetical protein
MEKGNQEYPLDKETRRNMAEILFEENISGHNLTQIRVAMNMNLNFAIRQQHSAYFYEKPFEYLREEVTGQFITRNGGLREHDIRRIDSLIWSALEGMPVLMD